jgi:hypothetical protein
MNLKVLEATESDRKEIFKVVNAAFGNSKGTAGNQPPASLATHRLLCGMIRVLDHCYRW